MKRYILLGIFVFFSLNDLFAQSTLITVSGRVVDENGRSLPYVNVFFPDIFEGDVSDSTGRFAFLTHTPGKRTLTALLMGYEKYERELDLRPGQKIELTIRLLPTVILTPGTSVTASAFTSGEEKGVTLRSMEVVTTPGAAADIYLVIQTYPGVSKLDEGSGLFVRGGDVSETVTLLDQATVVHPYRWESPTGGVFGTITPFLVRGTFFSSGGFSAKYGNALSGVLAMESQGLPEQSFANVNVGLAGVSAGITQNLIPGKLGFRFTGNYVHTGIMFRLNRSREEFSVLPASRDGNFGLVYKYSTSGQIKVFAFASRDWVGVRVAQPSFDGLFDRSGTNQLYNIQWSDLVRENWLSKTSLSLNRYRSDLAFGILDLSQQDDTYKLRTDQEITLNRKVDIHFGAETELVVNRFKGTVPRYRLLLDPNAESYSLDDSFGARRDGFYAETIWRPLRKHSASLGVRVDHHNRAAQTVADPRFSYQYSLNKEVVLRFSTGLFHQFAAPYYFAPGFGNPRLNAMRAKHWIVGVDWFRERFRFRVEAYHKRYHDLVLNDPESGYANRGYGHAAGIDLFLKFGELFRDPINGWLSYSFLRSRRLSPQKIVQIQETGVVDDYRFREAPSPFDITHNLTLVTKVSLTPQFNVGATFRIATGRPITPIVDAVPDFQFPYYHPIEGDPYSERLPLYWRLDTSATYYQPLHGSNFVVFFAGFSNLTNRKNVLDYDYSYDYSSRIPRTTNFSRFIYVGASLTVQL